MRDTISISLPRDLKERLDGLVQLNQMNRSDVVREALRQYIHKEEFRQLRREMIPRAESRGIYTDDDVFEQVS
jgi:metal-responsive CopG/Arc/MetJ family transcriptional regulator